MDLILFDLAVNHYHGYFAATSGNIQEEHLLNPNMQGTLNIMKKAFDIGPIIDYDYTSLSAEFILNSKYNIPEVIKQIAKSEDSFILKESMGLDLQEVSKKIDSQNRLETTGLYYWSMGAFTNAESVKLTTQMLKDWNLITNNYLEGLYKKSPKKALSSISNNFEQIKSGIAIEKANTYSYRHPHYFLSTVQCYQPNNLGLDQNITLATLGQDITVFINNPKEAYINGQENLSQNYWSGNYVNPYAGQHKNTALIYYDLSANKGYLEKNDLLFSHIYFPKNKFDEVYVSENELI